MSPKATATTSSSDEGSPGSGRMGGMQRKPGVVTSTSTFHSLPVSSCDVSISTLVLLSSLACGPTLSASDEALLVALQADAQDLPPSPTNRYADDPRAAELGR